jgi:hypothetical protein
LGAAGKPANGDAAIGAIIGTTGINGNTGRGNEQQKSAFENEHIRP